MANIESKSNQAVRLIAQTLLKLSSNQLPHVKVLAQQAEVGIGTVSKALEHLQKEGAIKTVGIQRLGTILEDINYSLLWHFAGYGPIKGILPMPISLSMEGLTQSVTSAVESLSIPLTWVYRDGAARRVQTVLRDEADFTIVSGNAFQGGDGLKQVHVFPRGSYYGTTGVFRLVPSEQRTVRKIGVDTSSPDHVFMVESEFPGIDLVDAPLRRIPGLIVKGEIDATVWYGGMAVQGEYINLLKIHPTSTDRVQTLSESPAVLVAKQGTASSRLLSTLDKQVLDHLYEVNSNV